MRLAPTSSTATARPDISSGMAISTGLRQWAEVLETATPANPAHIVVVGDSIAGPVMPRLGASWPHLLVDRLASRLGGLVSFRPVTPAADVTTPGGVAGPPAPGGRSRTLTNGQTMAHLVGGLGVAWIMWAQAPTGGTLTVRDGPGGAVVATIDTSGPAHGSRLTKVTGLTSGPFEDRTLHITSAGTCTVEMVAMGEPPVHVWAAATPGATTGAHLATPSMSLDLIDTLEATGRLGLVLVATGTNTDGPGSYTADLPALIAAIQARTTAQVAIWLPYASVSFNPTEMAEARPVAYATGLPVLDHSRATPTTADGTHPSAEGARQLAAAIGAAISGDPLSWIAQTATSQRLRSEDATGTTATEITPHSVTGATPAGTTLVKLGGAGTEATIVSPLASLLGSAPDGYLRAGKLGLSDLAAVPPGPNRVGDLAVVAGTLRICTVAGTPGTWVVAGTQT